MLELSEVVVIHRRSQPLFSRLRAKPPSVIRALDGVTLKLGPSESLGLIGESGSGKTTLGRAIIGLQPVTAGSIRFEGRELAGLSEGGYRSVRRHVSMIFQDPVASLSPRKRVGELLLEPHLIHRVDGGDKASRAADLLDTVGLDPALARAYPHQLSGGQARRVGIARAMALNPRLIIADEPTAGLDVSVQSEVINLMVELQARTAVSYLFITHNLALARHVCDRLAIIYRGMLCEVGPTEVVLANPSHPYTRLLVAGVSTSPHGVIAHAGTRPAPPVEAASQDGCPFAAHCDHARTLCREVCPAHVDMPGGQSVSCHYPISPGAH